ncbi:MAG: tRNA (guanosine(46)-N7)-methyltransferase TrmB [Lachnospiraceae bacterium]|nr:tRNA (guanosine(46)-N7)-methyltransferase TrmB [Lachnospiraceae bacterium]
MRLKNVPGSREMIAESEYTVSNPEQWKGNWHSLFENNHPIRIEIGTGKGKFIHELAMRHPEVNFIGIEKYSSVLIRAVEKQEQNPLPNLLFVRMDAEYITDVFGENETDRIYLNFSDPWPKDRHAKRRLTSREYLSRYRILLPAGGCIEFKTDNTDLFSFSLEEIALSGWTLLACTHDLHGDEELNRDNIMTEYEEKFSAKGNPICKLIAQVP